MKRRQLLQMGVTATTLPGLANPISAKPTGKLPMVLTRGHFKTELTYEGRRFTGQKVVLKDGHTKTGYDTNGSVPGIDRGCVQDLTVVIHGLDVPASGAIDKVQEYKRSLQRAGYEGTVIGYSWDSDIAGKQVSVSQKTAPIRTPEAGTISYGVPSGLPQWRAPSGQSLTRCPCHHGDPQGARSQQERDQDRFGPYARGCHRQRGTNPRMASIIQSVRQPCGPHVQLLEQRRSVLTFAYPGWPLGESGVEWVTRPEELHGHQSDRPGRQQPLQLHGSRRMGRE